MDPTTPEVNVASETGKTPKEAAEALNFWQKTELALKNPKVKEGFNALIRTTANVGITLADFVPGVGDAVSWTADGLKVLQPYLDKAGIKINLDLSPDVPTWVALASEGVEPLTGGLFPSHIVETAWQLTKDWGKMAEGFKELKSIYKAEQKDYDENKQQIDEALGCFGVTPPLVPAMAVA